MMVYSKQSYEDQDDGSILKAARKQQYIMFPALISFLKDELKVELGMKSNKEEDDAKSFPLKVPMDVNTSGQARSQIPHVPLGDESSPSGR
jgi:hypothetical protein